MVGQWQDGVESSSSSAVDIASTETSSSYVLTHGMAWAVSLTQRGGIREEISKICFLSSGDGNYEHLLYRFASKFSLDCSYIHISYFVETLIPHQRFQNACHTCMI